MKRDTIVVHEHQRLTIVAQRRAGDCSVVSQTEADAILRACLHIDGQPVSAGYRCLQFGKWCGVIQVASVVVEILPKVADHDALDRDVMLRMLALAYDFPLSRLAEADRDRQSHSLLPCLIRWFCDELFCQLRAGLLRGYVSQGDTLRSIRGRWRPDLDATRGIGQVTNFNCEFDEFTANNDWNRVFKTALCRARHFAAGEEALLRDIATLTAWLIEASDEPATIRTLRALPTNRLVSRFRVALRMAAWFLEEKAGSLRGGTNPEFALLFEMNMLFQVVLGAVLKRALPAGYELRTEAPRYFLTHSEQKNGGCFQMKPDFCVLRDGEVELIIDAKWKRLEPDAQYGKWAVRESDVYQLHAYSTAYQCDRTALWYPFHVELSEKDRPRHTFLRKGKQRSSSVMLVDWLDVTRPSRTQVWRSDLIDQVSQCLARLGLGLRAA